MTAATEPDGGACLDVSQRQLMRRAELVGMLMRHSVNLVVAGVVLAVPQSQASSLGKFFLVTLAAWSAYRLATRSSRAFFLAVDYILVLAVCLGIPLLVDDPHFFTTNTAPQAIAGTAVVSFSVSVPLTASLPMTAGVASAYAWGAAEEVGIHHLGDVAAIYYFVLQWITGSLIRLMLIRVAAAVDRARETRQDAELLRQVSEAVCDYDREQLALLHDTAASTLLMVGQGTSLPPGRLVAQAQRDLRVLTERPWLPAPERIDIAGELRECATHLCTPVEFAGSQELWIDRGIARAVVAAAREAMNNVDRHARASTLNITVAPCCVRLVDDGVGFDPQLPRAGHGITDSIVSRMQRVGGRAWIRSATGQGTVTELRWGPAGAEGTAGSAADPDQMIERIKVRYGLALTGYALANLAFAVPHAAILGRQPVIDAAMAAVAALSTLAAVPGILKGHWARAWAWPALLGLMAATVIQPAVLEPDQVGGYAHWAQSSIGWCVLPLLLPLPVATGASVLVLYWIVGVVTAVLQNPTTTVWVNAGLGTGSILGVQLFALAFNSLMQGAAVEAQAQTEALGQLLAHERVAQALRAEYQDRFANLLDSVLPFLQQLCDGAPSTDENLQRRARAESRRLRALFDQEANFDHPLMRRLRPVVDAAEAREVEVVIDLAGELPGATEELIASMMRPLERVMETATTAARLVVTGSAEEIAISIVCDAAAEVVALAGEVGANGEVETVTSELSVWFLIRHQLPKSACLST